MSNLVVYTSNRQEGPLIRSSIANALAEYYRAGVSTRERADTFTRFVGLELKGRIISQGFNAQSVAQAMGRSASALNRWLNGKVDIPLAVLCEACEVIDIEPQDVVEAAYSRMAVALGERSGFTYAANDARIALEDAEELARTDVATVRPIRPAPVSDPGGMIDMPAAADEGGGVDHEVEDEQGERST